MTVLIKEEKCIFAAVNHSAMKRLKIRNLGPLSAADVDLGQVNVIVGMQSSGKSCVLKTACYCSWVEKRIELTQSSSEFEEGSRFLDILVNYHKMKGFIWPDTYISYESDYMGFSYDHSEQKFTFFWKEKQWDYQRPKVSYIPSDRNLVATIPTWSKLTLENDNLLDFMTDWDIARKSMDTSSEVLNLKMSYHYDSLSNKDIVVLPNDKTIQLSEGSSGIQSLVPMFMHLHYLFGKQHEKQSLTAMSFEKKNEAINLASKLHQKAHEGIQTTDRIENGKVTLSEQNRSVVLGTTMYVCENQLAYERFTKLVNQFLLVNHNEIFLEEPEDNLFPPTQCQLVDWLVDNVSDSDKGDFLFVATHSPYVLNQFIKDKPKDFRIFFTHPIQKSGQYALSSLTEEDIQDVYYNGVDLFFNFEAYEN